MGVIYCFKDQQDTIIYIGLTIRDPKKRYLEHTKATSELNRYILDQGGFSKFTFEVLLHTDANSEELRFIERSYIEKYKPICNIAKSVAVQEERDFYFYKKNHYKQILELEEDCLSAMKI
jgi:hypothetical protein